jgi:hypothetical protein
MLGHTEHLETEEEINDRLELARTLYCILSRSFLGKNEFTRQTKFNLAANINILTNICKSWILKTKVLIQYLQTDKKVRHIYQTTGTF